MVLKRKYRQSFLDFSSPQQIGSPFASPELATPVSPLREPPPYRPPPPAPISPSSNNSQTSFDESRISIAAHEDISRNANTESMSPPVPPRRKSQDKLKVENKENVDRNKGDSSEIIIKVEFS